MIEGALTLRKDRHFRPGPEPLEQRIAPATFVVFNANDSGPGSFREAILQANATTGFDTIVFNIDSPGPVKVIQLQPASGPLPTITDPVLINGYTQPGSSQNTAPATAAGTNAVLNVVLDGSSLTSGDGLVLSTNSSTIAGLVIEGFRGAGIRITGDQAFNNVIAGNFIGTDAEGLAEKGNSGGGIVLFQANNNRIGGPSPAARNIISGNGANGILIDNVAGAAQGAGNDIFGNLIGLSAKGGPLGNRANGIALRDAANQEIGGSNPGEGNFIGFNGRDGILVGATSPQPEALSFGNFIRGNFIAENLGLGINLGRDGVTLNDPGDTDTGANGRTNFPLILSANVLPTITVLNGILQSAPGTTYELEFFASGAVDPSGYGEGAKPLGTVFVTTDATGQATFNFSASGDFRGQVFTATSTDNVRKDTSEFSLGFSPLLVTTSTDTIDSGDGLTSLREAILYANSNADLSTITFNIPGSALRSIKPVTELPEITSPVIIDGYSQPGASPNTLLAGNDAVLLIELDGSSITGGTQIYGVTLSGGGSSVRGLVINRFVDGGLSIAGPGGNSIVGNWIGTNADGLTAPTISNKEGITIVNSSNNAIGGVLPGDHNIISGNELYPINIRGGTTSTGNVIKGNAIGTTKDGNAPLTNGGEVYIEGNGTIFGGSEPGGRNVISTTTPGVDAIGIHSTGVIVRHNFIGIDLAGNATLGVGGAGIHVFSPNATIGGSGPGEGNVIAGATLGGIVIESDGATVQGNLIGTDTTGTLPRPNSTAGILILRGNNNTIGGIGSGAGNVIALNSGDGVSITGSAGPAAGNSIRGNSIFGNSGLGINLGTSGVTANDLLDADAGANTLQNFPIITSAIRTAAGTTINGSLNSSVNGVFTIDFYASVNADPSGFGEGRIYLGSTTTNPTNSSGNVTFNFAPSAQLPQGTIITATATNGGNSTSEFSAARAISTVFVWDAGAGGDTSWENPLNWDLDNGIPGATDTAILNIGSTITLNAGNTISTFQQSAGTFTSAAGVTLTVINAFDWTGGVQGGAGVTQMAATSTLTLGGSGPKGLNRPLINDGTTNWTSGNVNGNGPFTNNGVLVATAGATFTPALISTTAATFSQDAGSNVFSGAFNNSGTVKIVGGDVRFDGGGTIGGTISVGSAVEFHNGPYQFNGVTISGAGNVGFSGNHTFNGAGTYNVTGTTTVFSAGTTAFNTSSPVVFGTLKLTNATLTGSSNMVINSAFDWDSGTLGGSGTTTIGSTAVASFGGGVAKTLDRALVNNGTLTWGLGSVSGLGSITNNRAFETAVTSANGIAFTNAASGSFNQLSGNFTFTAPFTNAGTINITGGTLQLDGGLTQTAGVTNLAGGAIGGILALQGGVLSGSGTVNGSLNNSGGIVRPGGSGATGTLTITGSYTQGAGGTLNAELAGTSAGQFDVLAVGGTASLGGTLNINNLGGFLPAVGNQFRIVTSPGNPGRFDTLTGAATGISQQPDGSGLVLQANALVYTWDGGAGPGNTSWFEPLNWDLDSGFPGPADTAILGNAVNNTITIPDSLSVGTFRQNAGSVTSGPAITFTILNAFDWTGGTQSGLGATTVPSGATLNLSGGSTTLINRTLNIGGSAIDSSPGGAMTLANGATINLSGVFDFQNDDDILASGAGTGITLLAGGVLRKSAGGLTTEIQPAVTNNGTIDSQLGILRISNVAGGNGATFNAKTPGLIELASGNGIFGGTTTFSGGGVARLLDGNLSFNGPTSLLGTGTTLDIAGPGTVAIGGALTVPTGTFLNLATGTLTGTGTIDVAGTFTWNSGAHRGTGVTNILPGGVLNMSTATPKLLSVRTINHAGDASLRGSLSIENAAVFNLTGRLDLLDDADILSATTGGLSVQTGGALRKLGGAGSSDIAPGIALANSGTVQVDSGTMRIGNAAGGSNAVFQSASGAIIDLSGGNGVFNGSIGNNNSSGTTRISGGNLQFTGPAAFTGSSARLEITNGSLTLGNTLTVGAGATLSLSAGTLGGTGNLDILGALEWTGGTMSGSGTTSIAASATATLSGPADKQLITRTFSNTGTVNWSGTGQFALNGSTVNNSGTFNLQSDSVVSVTGGTPTFNNLQGGALIKSGGTGVSTFSIGIVVNNAGTINSQTGVLDLGSAFTQTGGATLLGPGGLASPGALTFQGGELRGAGTIAGGVNNIGATVRPGGTGAAGAIAISGAYTQGAGGTLAMEVGGLTPGTQYDQLNVGGTATLGGAFEVTLLAGFTPPAGSQFQAINATSRAGTFTTESITPEVRRQYSPTGVVLVGPAAPPSTIVTTALDVVDAADGLTSLREAILFANSNPGLDVITFNIPGSGLQSIRPVGALGALPVITDSVIIDGFSQPGSSPNTAGPTAMDNAVRLIEISGVNLTGFPNGLQISAGGSTVKGLIVTRFGGSGIVLDTNGGNVISGNLIGTDADGVSSSGNRGDGIQIINSSGNTIGGNTPGARNRIVGNSGHGVAISGATATGNIILGNLIGTDGSVIGIEGNVGDGVNISGGGSNIVGGTSPEERNILSGSRNGSGVRLTDSSGNTISGNFIGTDLAGTARVPNSNFGIFLLDAATNNVIGGTAAGAGNVIGANSFSGILIGGKSGGSTGAATGNRVEGNFIGTNATGAVNLGNLQHGVAIINDATDNIVGGAASGAANVISGNAQRGINVSVGATGTGNVVAGNFIGTDTTGTLSLGNGLGGIAVTGALGLDIGGTNVGEQNIIAFNGGPGVSVDATSDGVRIVGNSIYSNNGLSIDLNGDGFTPNDASDADTGANHLQNFPVLTSAVPDPGGTRISGSLNSTPNTTFRIEFFRSDVVDGNGVGEGKVFLGFQDVTTDALGNVTYNVVVSPTLSGGQYVTATATDLTLNNTSEFSVAAVFAQAAVASIDGGLVVEGDSGNRTIVFHVTLDRSVASGVTINFATQDRTAIGGLDYTATSGIVTFAPNETEQTISIPVLGDTLDEFRERFAVVLSNGQGASIGSGEAIGVIQDDDHHSFAVGQGAGNSFRIYTVNASGATLEAEIQPFAFGFKGGVRVATGDVTGDGVDDFIAGAGLGGRGRVRVYDGVTLDPVEGLLGDLSAYGNFYRGGVFVAAGDVNGDGRADIIVSPSAGSHNEVRIFSGVDGSLINSFQALSRGSGGVRVAAGDVNGDGLSDIIVGAGLGSKVRVFDALSGTILSGRDFNAFDRSFRGGVFVSAGDINNDGIDDIITSGGSKSATVKIFEQGVEVPNDHTFRAYTGALRGVHVAAGDINGDGIADIIATKGGKTDGKLRVFAGTSLAELFNFTPFGKAGTGNYLG